MLVEPATAQMATGVRPRARSAAMAAATGSGVEAVAIVGGEDHEGLGREAQLVERARDGEVGLVARVDADALEPGAPGRPRAAPDRAQVDVADERHRDEVGHHAARRAQPEAARAIAHEVAQPAHDLLLHEGAARARVPDVDALVRPLGEHLAGDGRDERRRREVRQRARVVGVERVGRDAGGELVDDRLEGGRVRGGRARAAGLPEVQAPQLRVAGGAAHGADHRLVVEPVQAGAPGRLAGALERGPGGGRVADADELGLRVPPEGSQGVVHRRGIVHRREW